MLPTREDYEDVCGLFPIASIVKIYGSQTDKACWWSGTCDLCENIREIAATLRWNMIYSINICTVCFPRLKPTFDQLGWPNMRNGPHLWAKYYLSSMPGVSIRSTPYETMCTLCGKIDNMTFTVELRWRVTLCQHCYTHINNTFDTTSTNVKRECAYKLLIVARSTKGCDLHRDIFRIVCAMWATMVNTVRFGRIAAANWPVP